MWAMYMHGIGVILGMAMPLVVRMSAWSFMNIHVCMGSNFLNHDFVWKPCDEMNYGGNK